MKGESTLNIDEVGRQRLVSQRVSGEKVDRPGDVMRRIGAMQAQDYAQALWGIGLRMTTATTDSVERAILAREIVRTWPMRGTLHFVPAEDAKWMLELCAARQVAGSRRRREELGLDDETMARCGELFGAALSGGKRLARPDMMKLLDDARIVTNSQRGYHILWYWAQSGLICLGPMEGKQQTFVLLDEWVPHALAPERDEALGVLAERYFVGHGPATVHDFAWWAGLTMADARRGVEVASDKLETVTCGDRSYWTSVERASHLRQEAADAGVHLLPAFDEFLLGYQDRSAVLAEEFAGRVVPGNNGVFQPIIVVDGRVVGTWKRALKRNRVEVSFEPFASFDHSSDDLHEAVERFGTFIGLPAVLVPGAKRNR